MFDARLRPIIDRPLNVVANRLVQRRITANQLSLLGLGLAVAASISIATHTFWLALILIVLNRLADGLDGPVARIRAKQQQTAPHPLGGFIDIVFDFLFYGLIPFAFIIANPQDNAFAGAALLLGFYLNGAAFLSFAILAKELNLSTSSQGQKSFYYLAGLTEGAETIVVFVLFCLFPAYYNIIAWCFAIACYISALTRIIMVIQQVSKRTNG
ncbi:CDP-alcohol phosphatidyltransferase family protein [Polycladidibacter stylochi]|uniref:CDP-alcohol phosphatidyltransferase family protein n=1 Tax=Polycladidibacter stylochi TaxID=1807766 RepID=UPI000834CB61|nr:CDP-alcohol phosphatidyltransferase family protein [Pseudovibrio stylochi]